MSSVPLTKRHNDGGRDEKLCIGTTSGFFNILVMSVGFMVLFIAYNTIQNYVTSLLGPLGNISLSVLYASVGVSVFFAPIITHKIGEKWTMVVGAVCYVAYFASLVKIIPALVIVASVIIGFGAAILWVAQGAYLTINSTPGSRGYNSGVFWTIFQICNVVGNLIAFFVLKYMSVVTLFITFTIIGVVGVIIITALRNVKSEDSVRNSQKSVRGICSETIHTFRERKIILLMPMFFWTGFELAFWTGEFTQLLKSDVIGLVLMVVGVAEIIGGVLMGKISDYLGRPPTIFFGAIVYTTALVLTAFIKIGYYTEIAVSDAPLIAFFAAFFFGLGDSIFNTQVYAFLGDYYPDNSVGPFTLFQLFQNVGSAIGFYYAIPFPLHGISGNLIQIWVQLVVLVVSCIGFAFASPPDAVGKKYEEIN